MSLKKNELEGETKSLRTKYDAMEKISRALQAEREVFKQKLKDYEQREHLEENQTTESEPAKSE